MPPKKANRIPEKVAQTPDVPEPINDLDRFSQVTRRHNQDPRWSLKSATLTAYRVWVWMDDRTTSKLDVEGVIHGIVWYGRDIGFDDIATDLGCSYWSLQRAVKWLVDVEFISRRNKHAHGVYSYTVLNSTRKLKGEVKKPTEGTITRGGHTYADKGHRAAKGGSWNKTGETLGYEVDEFLDEDEPGETPRPVEEPKPAPPPKPKWTNIPHSNQVRCPYCSFTGDVWNKEKHMEHKHFKEYLDEAAASFFGNERPISNPQPYELCNDDELA